MSDEQVLVKLHEDLLKAPQLLLPTLKHTTGYMDLALQIAFDLPDATLIRAVETRDYLCRPEGTTQPRSVPLTYYELCIATDNSPCSDRRIPAGELMRLLFHATEDIYNEPYEFSPSEQAVRSAVWRHLAAIYIHPSNYLRRLELLFKCRDFDSASDAKMIQAFGLTAKSTKTPQDTLPCSIPN